MNPFIFLIPITFIMMIGSWLSYQRSIKDSAWFMGIMITLGAANASLWVTGVRWSDSQRQVYNLSIAIDAITVLSYSMLPLLISGVKLSPTAMVGVMMVVIGAIIVKWA